MQFTSFEFLIFFPVVVLLYYIMPRRLRQFWLLLASYYFYMSWNAKYGILILASTVITYLCALLIARMKVQEAQGKTKRKLILITAIITNLALLVFFKYFYFLHDTAAMVSSIFGVELKESRLEIVLPVGISFYTFQALGYTIDVYRGTVKAEKNFIRYALFVSFFPQLVAGPIERSKNLLWQIENMQHQRIGSFEKITRGLLLMLWGFFMKMVIADRAAVLVNQVFDVYYLFDGVALLMASVLFAVQIYCDFASYSIIAMGAAKVLGIELMINFEAPFFSTSIRKLWRRWHVSLSSWFRDYLYIPMGGSRCSKPRKYLNTLITFLASGFWHGASWHFVVWGAIQGIYIIIGDLLDPLWKWVDTVFHVRWKTLVCQFCRGICTFLLFAFSFVFFRADTVKDAIYFLQRMVQNFDVWSLFDE